MSDEQIDLTPDISARLTKSFQMEEKFYGSPPIGSVIAYAGEIIDSEKVVIVDNDWLLCNGVALRSVGAYALLYAAIKNAHGNGSDDPDPQTDFNLPDYRGYFLRGVSGKSGRDPNVDGRTFNHQGGFIKEKVGSVQNCQVQDHAHTIEGFHLEGSGGHGFDGAGFASNSAQNHPWHQDYSTRTGGGGKETRPINAYVHWIIRFK